MMVGSISIVFSNRIIKNLVSVFLGDMFSKLIAIFITIILARYLGPERYGIYSFVTSFSFIFLIIADFGLNDLIIRDIAKDRTLAAKYFKASAIIKAVLSIISINALILSVIVLGYSSDKILYTIILSASIFFISMNNTIISFFKAVEKMEYSLIIAILGSLLLLIFCIVIINFKGSLREIIISRVVSVCGVTIIGLIIFWKIIGIVNEPIDIAFIKKILGEAFPFLTNGIIHTLYFSLDILMLSKMKGDVYVGWFTPAANDLFFSLLIIPGTVSTVVYPIFSRQYKDASERLRKSCNFCIKMLTIIGVAVSIGTFYLAPQIINLIFGPKYENSIIVLRVISIAIPFVFMRDPIGYALSAVGEVKALMKINIFMLILNVAMNTILIPLYAHVGAAITTTVCIFISLLIGQYVLSRKISGLIIWENFMKPIIAASIMLLVLGVLCSLHVHIILIIAIAAIVFVSMILILKTFDENEFEYLKGLAGKVL